MTEHPPAMASPFTPVAAAGHLGFFGLWSFGGEFLGSRPGYTELASKGQWGAINGQPLFVWGILSLVAAVLLLLGMADRSRHLRLAGWTWGALLMAWVSFCEAVSAYNNQGQGAAFAVALFIITAAHTAAASRE